MRGKVHSARLSLKQTQANRWSVLYAVQSMQQNSIAAKGRETTRTQGRKAYTAPTCKSVCKVATWVSWFLHLERRRGFGRLALGGPREPCCAVFDALSGLCTMRSLRFVGYTRTLQVWHHGCKELPCFPCMPPGRNGSASHEAAYTPHGAASWCKPPESRL